MSRTLSDDVRLVGDTLGHVLKAQGGEALFETVELMRLAAKEAREGSAEKAEAARSRLDEVAARLTAAEAREVVRAFTLYFQLLNLAEDEQRARELRRREIETAGVGVSESLPATIADLVGGGASRESLLAALGDVHIGFVFTAHPTEARRRTTERLLADVRANLSARARLALVPAEERRENRRLRAAIEALWEHAAERRERPEVLEEVKAGLWYLRNVLLDQVPRIYRRIAFGMEQSVGSIDPATVPDALYFGSWMGSDRDGNPFVTDGVTERTLELHRSIILERYIRDLDELVDPLAATSDRLPTSPALADALLRASAAVPEVALEAERRNPTEPLRRLLTFARARIDRTRTFSAGAYHTPQAFLRDLEAMRDALRSVHADALADDRLLELCFRVRTFGFHLASLDVREDSGVHRSVIGELLGDAEYESRDPEGRRQALERLALPHRGEALSSEAERLLGLFATVARAQARFGPEALHTYVISMTESATDVLEVLALAELHGNAAHLDVAPLLETPDDLARTEPLLTALLSDARYRTHLERRGDVQELLVGYSDSMKQGGILASRFRVLEAQRAAARVCAAHGVVLRVFHGRGGSVSRGGGPTYRAIASLPREAFSGQIKITEQGEMRAYNFASPDLAARYLEQTVGASLVARHEARASMSDRPAREEELMAGLAEHSLAAYRALVGDPELVVYFREATPFSQIAALNIASRPAKRRKGAVGLSDLRAIPWVFAWSQSRYVLTGWYGVGSALEALASERAELERLYEESPFFRDLLSNVEMTLAKADMEIARRYAALTTDPALGHRIHARILAEHDLTVRHLLGLTGQRGLLEKTPVLQRSIRLRNPYVDPMSWLQVTAIQKSRGTTDDAERAAWERVARLAVQGIAAGLRHTG